MAQPDPNSGQKPLERGLEPDDVNQILRQKRKSRTQRACYPCRQRKVRCDYSTPCQTCRDRQHPDLCDYEPPSKRINHGPSNRSAPGSVSSSTLLQDQSKIIINDGANFLGKIQRLEQSIQEIKKDIGVVDTDPSNPSLALRLPTLLQVNHNSDFDLMKDEDFYAPNPITGDQTHFGAHSVVATVAGLSNAASAQNLTEAKASSLLGLDNYNVTYPFVDLGVMARGSLHRVQELCRLIPPDTDTLRHFRSYRDIAHVLFPGVIDLPAFESDLNKFLAKREASSHHDTDYQLSEQDIFGASLHWVALLFAILASGCQWSEIPAGARQLTSRIFVCCAYDCLRITNYLSYPTLVDIQALLVLGNVISNNMDAGVAWAFLGLVIRLAQSLGLHRPRPVSVPSVEQSLREEIWWRVVWQESLLSITFDRTSCIQTTTRSRPGKEATDHKQTYIDCMKIVSEVGLDIVRERSDECSQQSRLALIACCQNSLDSMMDNACQHLCELQACRSIRDQLEYWNLALHKSYMISELYRSFLRKSGSAHGVLQAYHEKCLEGLIDTVQAFLGLQDITHSANRSWAAVHRALSSGLLLAIMKKHHGNDRVWTLLNRLINTMSSIYSQSDLADTDTPVTRSIAALSNLVIQDDNMQSTIDETGNTGKTAIETVPSSVSEDSPSGTRGDFESAGSHSPYTVVDKILWGD